MQKLWYTFRNFIIQFFCPLSNSGISSFQVPLNTFRLQLWPGYETSIRYHEHGILLNCDVANKIMRTDTVYDLLMDCRRTNPKNFMDEFKRNVLGLHVLTNYNNKMYRVDDVDFAITPSSTFTKNDEQITILQYYATVKQARRIS